MNIVKYNNNLNSVGLRSFTAGELDLLMSICHKLKDKGTGFKKADTNQKKSQFKRIYRINNEC